MVSIKQCWTLSGFRVAKRRRRGNWSDDEKRMICAQTRLPGVSVSQVARRYDVNANQVFNWLKDPEFSARPDDGDVTRFLSVEVVEPARPGPIPIASAQGGQMEVGLAGGHRLKIIGAYDPEALALLIRKLSA